MKVFAIMFAIEVALLAFALLLLFARIELLINSLGK
jgi:hypothetical protein